ncbi:uncharacterized protein [Epargyreus clarus]|uniref:uncharacterized protein n=1 Tax=Epargyreus clarus TaxID=520877 RepID=UPI003C2BD68F
MTQVLNKIREVDPNDSEAVKEVVTSFFQNLTKIGESDPIKWLRTLVDVINRFPKYCMSHRSTIESILTSSIDSNDYYYVIEAAKCAQALQQVRPSQEKTATPKTSWREQMSLLCDAAHSLIAAIFPNAVDVHKGNKNGQREELSSNSTLTAALMKIHSVPKTQNKGEKKTVLQTRLRNVFCFIQAMLVEIYPVPKPIRPQLILDVVVRALSVSSGAKDAGVDVGVIKVEALRTLDALVACLGPNLIPFSPLVFRLLMQTFRWSENADKNFRNVRCTAYNSLSKWLNTLHVHRAASDSRSSWEDELTKHIVEDIAPPEKIVELTMGPQPTKHMSKKAKRKLANAKLLESSIASHAPGEKNKANKPEELNNEVAMAALDCAETFLLVCGRFLKPATHKLFQERAIRECYYSHKYTDEQAAALLRVVEAARTTTPATLPPPTQHCLQLYSTLINRGNGEISKFCTQALLDIRLHLHCSPPSLSFALEAPLEKQKSSNKRKKVSEKNRAALESLLGSDRMSALNTPEVITIADEPSSKKPRLEEDEADQISVSSDSISSVEISDDSDVEEIIEEVDGSIEESSHTTTVVIEKTNDTVSVLEDNNIKDVKTIPKENVAEAMEEDDIAKPDDQIFPKDSIIETEAEVHTIEEDINTDTQVQEKDKTSDAEVQDKDRSDEGEPLTKINTVSIHDAPTQAPLNVSTETVDGEEGPFSLEVTYDYPSTGTAKVNVFNNSTEEEALPSTSDTDDVITCGQLVKSSQDSNTEKKSDDTDVSEATISIAPKVNGNVSESERKNGVDIPADNVKDADKETAKTASKDEGVSIEEMMADFVDEVSEDITVA